MNDSPPGLETAVERVIQAAPDVIGSLSALGPWGAVAGAVLAAILLAGGAYLTWRARKRANEKAALESALNRQRNITETESQGRALDRDFSNSADAADRSFERWERERES